MAIRSETLGPKRRAVGYRAKSQRERKASKHQDTNRQADGGIYVRRTEINKERLTVNLRQEEGTKQTDGEKECKTGIQPKPMKKKCICAQVRETDIQMDRWNMLEGEIRELERWWVSFLKKCWEKIFSATGY